MARKKKAVAYTRVSTKSDAQIHSYEYQNEYWQQVISANPLYEFNGIYADKGISGRAIAKRPQLLKLLKDAKSGKVDVIFTKSVARFARNTEELLNTVRELRDIGVKVFFEKENIDTFDPNSEMFLTIAAAVAENDLQIYSDNQRWSVRERYKNGFYSIGNKILGYRMDGETNTLQIEPEGADTVRRIFELYQQCIGVNSIIPILTKEGRKNAVGEVHWGKSGIWYILKNEKYKGCSLSQKTITNQGVTVKNNGDVPQYYMENVHEAIISSETFDRVQKLIEERSVKKLVGKPLPRYPFTGKVKCGNCGHGYTHKIQNCNFPWRTGVWVCQNQHSHGYNACDSTRIKDSVLYEKFVECYNEFIQMKYENPLMQRVKQELQQLLSQEQELIALKVNGMVSIEAYNKEVTAVRAEIDRVKSEILKYSLYDIRKSDFKQITEFDEEKVDKFIDKVTIHKGVVTFTFINGVSISRPYTNGPSGNQVGWLDRKKEKERQEAR